VLSKHIVSNCFSIPQLKIKTKWIILLLLIYFKRIINVQINKGEYMKTQVLFALSLVVLLLGCSNWRVPDTAGDPKNAASYGYQPIDPLPVNMKYSGILSNKRILDSLPDETMRLAIGEVLGSGGITFGLAKAGYKGNSYVVILDYIKFNTESFGVKLTQDKNTQTTKASLITGEGADVIVPTYLGVGLRLTANVTVNEGSVDLGNLFALGVAAQSKKISGTLVVQTLGISGENISTIIPMPSELNPSTIQNAIMSLGAIKAKIYQENTIITPRIVGVYNNLGGGRETINGFISSLLEKPLNLEIK